MQSFTTLDQNTFRFNGLKFNKSFNVIKQSNTHLAIHNAFDTTQQLLSSTHFNQIQVNGVVYNSLSELLDVLVPLVFNSQSSSGGDLNFVFTQNIPASVWNVTHNLNKKPSVTITDSAGTIVEGQVEYLSLTQIRCTFSAAFSGVVIFN